MTFLRKVAITVAITFLGKVAVAVAITKKNVANRTLISSKHLQVKKFLTCILKLSSIKCFDPPTAFGDRRERERERGGAFKRKSWNKQVWVQKWSSLLYSSKLWICGICRSIFVFITEKFVVYDKPLRRFMSTSATYLVLWLRSWSFHSGLQSP